MRISDLFIYPLKSARGIAIPFSDIDAFGLPGDRRAMITDAQGHFVTQRELQDLARIEVRPEASAFRLLMDGKGEIAVPPLQPGRRMDVSVWKEPVNAAVADDDSNRRRLKSAPRACTSSLGTGEAKRIASACAKL